MLVCIVGFHGSRRSNLLAEEISFDAELLHPFFEFSMVLKMDVDGKVEDEVEFVLYPGLYL